MAFAQSKAVQGKVWKIPELAERIVLFLDPLSLLRLVQAGVLSKQVLKKSISTPVWKNLIRRGSYGEDGLQNLVEVLKLIKEPGALLLPLLEAICEKFPSVERDEVLVRCPHHAEPHSVSSRGFLLLEDVEAAFGTTVQLIESLSAGSLGEPILSAAGSRVSRQQKRMTSISVLDKICLENNRSALSLDTLLQALQVKIRQYIVVFVEGSIGEEGWKVLSRAMQLPSFQMADGRNVVQSVHASKPGLAEGRREDIKAIWDAVDWRFVVYKSAQALHLEKNENALFVLKSSRGTWRKLERILDMTFKEFDAAEPPCFWASSSSAGSDSDSDSSESERC